MSKKKIIAVLAEHKAIYEAMQKARAMRDLLDGLALCITEYQARRRRLYRYQIKNTPLFMQIHHGHTNSVERLPRAEATP